MFKSLLSFLFCLTAALMSPVSAQTQPATVVPNLTAEQANLDMRVLRRVLLALHPALTKYRSQAEMDAAVATFEARGNAARTPTEMYLAATELAAAIRCGHTWTNVLNQSGITKAALLDSANKLPFTMTLVEGRWLVLASADVAIQKGDEVLAVNNIAAREMVAMMMPYLRADGSSDGKRLRQLGHDRLDFSQMDILWPLLSPPVEGKYNIELRRTAGGMGSVIKVNAAATTIAARKASLAVQGVKPIDPKWRFRIENNVGYLTLPNFAFWNSKFDWAGFLANTFAELNNKSVPHLVIDIRDNEGGDGAIGGAVMSYLIAEPLRFKSSQAITAYERVPYIVAKYLDTWDYSFFDRTGLVEKVTEGTAAGKFVVSARANSDRIIQPAARSGNQTAPYYRGKVYLLVGPENSSATFQFADLAKRSGVVKLVGQVTGGNQRGLNGGELTWVTLPNSGVAVDIPLLAARYEADTPDASVTPHVLVKRTFDGQRAGRDEEIEVTQGLIERGAPTAVAR
jgi:hypothetical protein